MKFYEIKLNVVIDRNPHQALKHLRSAFKEMFEKNRHLNTGNVNLLNIEEKKKKINLFIRISALDFQIFK